MESRSRAVLLYVKDKKIYKTVCNLGLNESTAIPYTLMQTLLSNGCIPGFIAVDEAVRPVDLIEARRAGIRGVAVLDGDPVRICAMAEALGLVCGSAVQLTPKELKRRGSNGISERYALVRVECSLAARLRGMESCVESVAKLAEKKGGLERLSSRVRA